MASVSSSIIRIKFVWAVFPIKFQGVAIIYGPHQRNYFTR